MMMAHIITRPLKCQKTRYKPENLYEHKYGSVFYQLSENFSQLYIIIYDIAQSIEVSQCYSMLTHMTHGMGGLIISLYLMV